MQEKKLFKIEENDKKAWIFSHIYNEKILKKSAKFYFKSVISLLGKQLYLEEMSYFK